MLYRELQNEKEDYRGWKQGQIAWVENRKALPASRNQVRKAKTLTELNLARYVKGNKKSFYRYVGDRRKTKENIGSLWKEIGDMVTWDVENS